MSTSALSKESLAYTYTTVPIFTNTMVGFSNSNTALIVSTTPNTAVPFNALSITIANPGVYLCEGNIGYRTNGSYVNVVSSLSTTSATLNTNNQAATVTSGGAGNISNVQTTSIITISVANTTLYCVGQSVNDVLSISNGFIKYTRIA